jgi:hypothetical protein
MDMLAELRDDTACWKSGLMKPSGTHGFSLRRGGQTARPVSWEVAGALFVAGITAYAAVRSVKLATGYTDDVSSVPRQAWVRSQCNWASDRVR